MKGDEMESMIRNLSEEIRRLENGMRKMGMQLTDEIRRECSNISREVDGLAKEVNSQVTEMRRIRRRLTTDPTVDQEDLQKYVQASKRGTIVDHILNMLHNSHPHYVSHSVILRKIYRRLSHKAPEFQWIINSLKQKGYIEETIISNSVFYKLTNLGLERRSARLLGQPLDAPIESVEPSESAEPGKSLSPWDALDGVIDLTK